MVNAEAMAITSLIRKSAKEAAGKGFELTFPNFWANALSLSIDAVLLTRKVIHSLLMDGLTEVVNFQ
jgi:hypothetical protein